MTLYNRLPHLTCNFRQNLQFLHVISVKNDDNYKKSGNVTHAKSLQKFVDKYGSKYRTIVSGRPLKSINELEYTTIRFI